MHQQINGFGTHSGDKKNSLLFDQEYLYFLAQTHPHFCIGQTLSGAPFFIADIATHHMFLPGLIRILFTLFCAFFRPLKAPRVMVIGVPFEPYDQSSIILLLPAKKTLKYLAKHFGVDCMMLTNSTHHHENFLAEQGFRVISSFPNSFIKLPYKSFHQYIYALPKKYRLNIVSMMRRFNNSEHRIEIIDDLSSKQLNYIFNAYDFMYKKSKVPWLYYEQSYFSSVRRLKNSIMLCAKNSQSQIVGTVIGFMDNSGFHVGRVMIHPDYDRKDGIYFRLLYACIEQAIHHNCGAIFLGPTSYRVKRALGAELQMMKNALLPVHPLWKMLFFLCPKKLSKWLLRHLSCPTTLEKNY